MKAANSYEASAHCTEGRSEAIPSIEERNILSSPDARESLFVTNENHGSLGSRPAPPVGPPPACAFAGTNGASDAMNESLDYRLPRVNPCRTSVTRSRAPRHDFLDFTATSAGGVHSIRDELEAKLKAEKEEITRARQRIDEIVGQPTQSALLWSALEETRNMVQAKEEPISTEEVPDTLLECPQLSSRHGEQCGEFCLAGEAGQAINHEATAQLCVSTIIETHVRDAFEREEIGQLVSRMEAHTQARIQAEINLARHEAVRAAELDVFNREQRKSKRVKNVKNLAELAGASTETGDSEREEIQRALAAVDETRRKRVERQSNRDGNTCQNNERTRRRQIKKEQLSKKRKDMEERLEEEASRMAQLTESAKKKGESKFMSEEAKRDAQERIQAETEVVAQLERHAAEMTLQREVLQRQIEEHDDVKVAEIEAGASALKAKRAEMEARMRQEEMELKALSESVRREVENKMVAEALAIAEMEQKAQKLSAKRAELEEQMINKLRQENLLVQETKKLSEKREVMEATARYEEEQLEKMNDDARHRALERMIMGKDATVMMERKAIELAAAGHATHVMQEAVDESNSHPSGPRAPSDTFDRDRLRTFEDFKRRGSHSHLYGDACPSEPLLAEDTAEVSPADIFVSGHSFIPPSNIETEDVPVRQDRLPRCELNPGKNHDRTQILHSEAAPEEMEHLEQDFTTEQMLDSFPCVQCHTNQDDMSSAHLAAAAGHVDCLQAISVRYPEQATKVDSSGRTPLFYACAAARIDAAELLIREGPQCCHLVDTNEDTPLHAAALAGSALCCHLLLEQGHVEVNPRNSFRMTPAHLAANNDVLEALSCHGADLNAKDLDSRTPLFMACASDRLEKAEFLCELLEYAGQDLGEADKRGDTPVHAAACNGSTACLLLLLQYGVAPDIRNTKGLRAIDLAARKGQMACEKILMEYQLHHQVDDSYFDSVLFLATLEGHKKRREVLSCQEQREYITTHAATIDPLPRAESLLPLRSGRSLRLRHWGDWIAYKDPEAQNIFWYNHVTQISQWETPPAIGEISTRQPGNETMRLEKRGDWIEYTLPDGNVFYFNDRTNEFQWQQPSQLSPRQSNEEIDKESEAITTEVISGESGDWGAFKDPSTGLVFWFNHSTRESQWEPPEDIEVANNAAHEEVTANGEHGNIAGER